MTLYSLIMSLPTDPELEVKVKKGIIHGEAVIIFELLIY